MSSSEGCEGVLVKVVNKSDECESDVSDSGTTIGSTIISSGGSSPSSFGDKRPSSTMFTELDRDHARASTSSYSSESLEHLYFIPSKGDSPVRGQSGNCNETRQEVLEGVMDMETEETQEVPEGPPANSEMETPKKLVMMGTGLETPKKREVNTVRLPARHQRPKAYSVLTLNDQGGLKRRKPRRLIYSSGSYKTVRGVEKIALRTVKNRMKPVENLLSSILDSIRLHITTSVREEVERAVGELRGFLDARLPLPRNKGKGPQQRQGRKKKCPQETLKQAANVRNKQVGNEDKQECTGENQLVAVGVAGDCDRTSENSSTEADSSPSQSSGQESSKRIIWANKRMRSETLVKKLKKYMELKEDLESTPQTSVNSESPEETTTPPNSPTSNRMSSPTTSPFTLGMVKVEPVDEVDGSFVPDEGGNICDLANVTFDEGMTTAPTPIPAAAEPTSIMDSLGLTGSAESHILLKTQLEPELMFKPELPLVKCKETIVCDVCGKKFLNNSSLRQHLSFHRPQRPFKCEHEDCDKCYKTKSELNRHTVIHTGQKNYECKQCGKKFLRKQYLKTHLLRHPEPLTKQCEMCFKIFVSEADHEKHKLSYHKNGKRSSFTRLQIKS